MARREEMMVVKGRGICEVLDDTGAAKKIKILLIKDVQHC